VKKSIEFELEDLNSRPDPEPLLVEMLHEAAFKDGPLGNAKLCSASSLDKIKKENLYAYMKTLYLPKRTVLTCIGIDHDEFIQMTNEKFNSITPLWIEKPDVLGNNSSSSGEIDARQSKWVGGSVLVEKDLSDLNQGSNNQLPVCKI
jgi:processing peptidase subunit alpha